jgi:hypothetical protein
MIDSLGGSESDGKAAATPEDCKKNYERPNVLFSKRARFPYDRMQC